MRAVAESPDTGERKTGDLAWLLVYKFRMVGQVVLLAYKLVGTDTIILHDVGSHENFYRDFKRQ